MKKILLVLLVAGVVIFPITVLAALPAFMSGYVIDAETGDGIGGAEVTSAFGGTTQTFSDGYFILTVTPGSGLFTALMDGYESKSKYFSLSSGDIVTWNVSLNPRQPGPPDTVIIKRPASFTKVTSATFAFKSNEPEATFSCKIDAGNFTSCVSPKTYVGPLAEGIHKFYVKATDVSGNVDLTPAVVTWTIDLTPPQTTITPACSNGDCTFELSSTEPNSTFRCKLDAEAYEICSSPVTYSGLGAGWHTLRVKSVDRAGNADPTPVVYQWY